MVVQHNLSAMNANRQLGITTGLQAKSSEKLSSGYRINRAADDAAGLAISEKMRGQIRGLSQASANAQDGISLIQTAEGALTETHSILQRMRELAVQAANDTATDDDRTQIQNEIDQLTQEVDRIANTTEFNTKKLLDGSRTGAVTEKAGSVNAESSFGNSMVSASVTTDGSAKAGFTDVIRLDINKDFKEGQSLSATPKMSSEQLDKLYSMLTGTTTELDAVTTAATKQTITTTGADPKQSREENIAQAKSAVASALDAERTNKSTSKTNVAANDKAIEATVKNIMTLAGKVETANGNTFLKDGVTANDLQKAIEKYKDALVENGAAAAKVDAGAATSANGSSDAISSALEELKALFYADDTADIGKDVVTTATIAANAADITAAAKDNNGGDIAKTTNAVVTKDTTKLGAVGKDVSDNLVSFVKSIAATEIRDNVNSLKVAQLEEVQAALNDTDMVNALFDYKDAIAKQTTVNGTTGVTEDAKAAAQAKVDSAKDALDKLNTASSPVTVSDLFGNSATADTFEIASELSQDNKLTINLKNKEGDDTVITIENAHLLKAGDSLTITSQKMVETKEAATGKEALRLQIGANAGQEMSLGINSMKASALDIVQVKEGSEGKSLDLTNQSSASMAVNAYDMAIQKVSTERAKMGAVQNRLEHTISNLDTAAENTQNAESRIRDTDMAKEMVEYSKNNILAQAGQSMLAQANQSTQGVLSLLQ